jgi:hypothetical protein
MPLHRRSLVPGKRRRLLQLPVCLLVLMALAASAGYAQTFLGRQRGGRGGGWGGFRRVPPRFATTDTFDGAFHFCRIMYESDRWEAGGQGWTTDYPGADINFSIRLSELTKTRVSMSQAGEPNYVVVRLTDEALFQCPFAIIEDVGTESFSGPEVDNLRKYLLKGGFIWADDFWGTLAWEQWVQDIGMVLPPAQYPIFDVPRDHPMLHTLFEATTIPQTPSIQFWRQSGGRTSERGAESAERHVRAIADEHGRVMVLMTHNTDTADSWEREGEDEDFFYRFSPEGYAFAIDVLLYEMTH